MFRILGNALDEVKTWRLSHRSIHCARSSAHVYQSDSDAPIVSLVELLMAQLRVTSDEPHETRLSPVQNSLTGKGR